MDSRTYALHDLCFNRANCGRFGVFRTHFIGSFAANWPREETKRDFSDLSACLSRQTNSVTFLQNSTISSSGKKPVVSSHSSKHDNMQIGSKLRAPFS